MFVNRSAAITVVIIVAISGTVNAEGEDAPAKAIPVEIFPLPANTVFERYVVGEGGTGTAAGERLVYSNTLGTFGASLGAGKLVSDDISIIAPGGCNLRLLEFPVVGKVNPAGIGGPYTVDFALYSSCPGSVPPASQPSLIIPGTEGQADFDDDAPRLISFVPAIDVALPTNFWFGVKFSRNNAGVVFGSPPLTGYSGDQFDYPATPCTAWAGGFGPPFYAPHASFNLEVYADADCPEAFVGYKNNNPSGPTYNPGAYKTAADDIRLGVNECQMIAYEVAVKGEGFYTFDLRTSCNGGIIAGTEKDFTVFGTTEPQIARFTFNTPIAVPNDFFLSAGISAASGGLIVSGRQACIGETADTFQVALPGGCSPTVYPPPPSTLPRKHAGFSTAFTCAGAAPFGACCDMVFLDANGDAVCREMPQMNCPWPPRFLGLEPQWVEGATCDSDPFPHPCGASACCRPNQVCENLTVNQCHSVPPIDAPRQWQRGRYCDVDGQRCPFVACLPREGDCMFAHQEPGCANSDCCTEVCESDAYCCSVEWDRVCVEIASQLCQGISNHDHCSNIYSAQAALLVKVDSITTFTNISASQDSDDPGFCCHSQAPGAVGFGTTWFKFTATDASALVATCGSDPASDSLINVFAVGDPTSEGTACATLIPIACGDDVEGCGNDRHGRICVKDLSPGQTYYVMVASKTQEDEGLHQLEIRSPCTVPPHEPGDFCTEALPILGGATPFNLALFSMTLPCETCIPSMANDVWYSYVATCSGLLTVDTCGKIPGSGPDTNLAIYDGDVCPHLPPYAAPIACSADFGDKCGESGLGSRTVIPVNLGNNYKIRLADSGNNRPSGELKVACIQVPCPIGQMLFTSPPNGVVDARRPHDPNDATLLESIQTITAVGPPDAEASCFTFCETAVPPPPHDSPNSIANVVQSPLGTYAITLARPITGGALTTITYADYHGLNSTGRYSSAPANVNGDLVALSFPSSPYPSDIQYLLDALNGVSALPWGNYSSDINRSLITTGADLLEEIDLLQGNGAYEPWEITFNPSGSLDCPLLPH